MSELSLEKGNKRVSLKRLPNFSTEETKILVAAVNEKRKIIDCKKLDKNSVCLKAEAWKEIEKAFNCSSIIFRPVALLKKKYENLKRELRKKPTAAHKSNLSPTENESFKKNPSESDESLSTRINEEENTPLHSIYDSDHFDESNDRSMGTVENLKNFIKEEPELEAQSPVCINEESPNRTENKEKAEVEFLKEQHEFKVKFMIEEHAFKMKCMQEKHSIEMKILEQQLKNTQNNKI